MTWRNINIIDTIVLAIIGLLFFLSMKLYFIPNSLKYPSYTIAMNDADGLIVGSQVLFDGKEVGHVTKLKFDDNQVYVTFVFEDDSMKKIPKYSEITIKSTGLAASKALEIYHDPKNIKDDIYVRDSIRQVTTYKVVTDINKQIIQAANSASFMMNEKQLLNIKKSTQDGIVTSYILKVLDKMVRAEAYMQKSMNNVNLKRINKKLEQAGDENKK